MRRFIFAATFAVLFMLVLSVPAFAISTPVTVSDLDELLEAITQADDGDIIYIDTTIYIVDDATIGRDDISVTIRREDGFTGIMLLVGGNWFYDEIHVSFQNLTIVGNNSPSISPIFVNVLNDDARVTIENVSIIDSLTNGDGGALWLNANVFVNNCTFFNTSASHGGGIVVAEQSYVVIENSTFTQCIADREGGAIYNRGKLEIKNVTFTDCSARDGDDIFHYEDTFFADHTPDDPNPDDPCPDCGEDPCVCDDGDEPSPSPDPGDGEPDLKDPPPDGGDGGDKSKPPYIPPYILPYVPPSNDLPSIVTETADNADESEKDDDIQPMEEPPQIYSPFRCGDAVLDISEMALFEDDGDSTQFLTRAEMMVILYRLLTDESREVIDADTNHFTDCDPDAFYNTAISTMANAGVVVGIGGGKFDPNGLLTWSQLLTIFPRFVDMYTDIELVHIDIGQHWSVGYVKNGVARDWIIDDAGFSPNAPVTRAEMAAFINHIVGVELTAASIVE